MSSFNDDDFDLLPRQTIVWDDSTHDDGDGDDVELVLPPPDDDLVDNLFDFKSLDIGGGGREERLVLSNSILDEHQGDGALYAPTRSIEEEITGSTINEEAGPSSGAPTGAQSTTIILEDDPLASLEAAIQDDKPKYKANKDWQAMIAAIQNDDDEGVIEKEEEGKPACPSQIIALGTTTTKIMKDQVEEPAATTLPDLTVLPVEEQYNEDGEHSLEHVFVTAGGEADDDDDDIGSKGLRPSISGRKHTKDYYYNIT